MTQEVINKYADAWEKFLDKTRKLLGVVESALEEEEPSEKFIKLDVARAKGLYTLMKEEVATLAKIKFTRDKTRVETDLNLIKDFKKDGEGLVEVLKRIPLMRGLEEELKKALTLIEEVIKVLENQKTPSSQVQKSGLPHQILVPEESSSTESLPLEPPKAKAKARPKPKVITPKPTVPGSAKDVYEKKAAKRVEKEIPPPKAKARPKAKAAPEEPPKSRGGRNKKVLPGNLQRYYEFLVDFHNKGLIDQKKKIPEKYRAYVLGHLRKGSFDPQTGADLRKRKRKTQFDEIIDIFRAKEKN